MEKPNYKYEVELKSLFSRDYSSDGEFNDTPGIENAKFYKTPNKMDWLGLDIKKDCQEDKSRQNYGLSERVIIKDPIQLKTNGYDKPRNFEKDDSKYLKNWIELTKKLINENLSESPDIFCNSRCILNLMQSRHEKRRFWDKYIYEAERIFLQDDKYVISVKSLIQKSTYANTSHTPHLNNILAFHKDDQTDENKTLQALYEASLTSTYQNKICNDRIKIAFTTETDGILLNNSNDLQSPWEMKDHIVAVKSADISWSLLSNATHFDYEERILQRSWAHCRIRGIKTFIFGLLEQNESQPLLLKEVWLYNVNEIPKIIESCGNKNKELIKTNDQKGWSRAFPKEIFSDSILLENQVDIHHEQLKVWTENDIFGTLHSALNIILRAFKSQKEELNTKKYFIRDILSLKNEKELEEISEKEYHEANHIKRKFLLTISKLGRYGIGLNKTQPEETLMKILLYLDEHKIPIKRENVQEFNVISSSNNSRDYQDDQVEIKFDTDENAKLFKKSWEKCIKNKYVAPYYIKIYYASTNRQRLARRM